MNLLRCVFALAVLYGLSAAAAAEPVTLLLPNECADFALNHDNGDLAMVSSVTNEAWLLRAADLNAGNSEKLIKLRVGTSPSSIFYKKYRNTAVYAIVSAKDSHMYLMNAADGQLLKKIELAKSGVRQVTGSLNPEDPFVFYTYGEGHDCMTGAINLRTMQHQAVAIPGAYASFFSASGEVAYKLGPFSPSGFESLKRTTSLAEDRVVFLRLFSEHTSRGGYLSDPFDRFTAVQKRIYSRDLSRFEAELPFTPQCFFRKFPVIVGMVPDEMRRDDKAERVKLQAASYNTFAAAGSVVELNLVQELKPKPRANPPRSRLFADDAAQQVIYAAGDQIALVSLADFELPDEPLLLATLNASQVVVDKPNKILLQRLDPRVSVVVDKLPPGMQAQGKEFVWTPTEDQMGAARMLLTFKHGDIQRTLTFELQVVKPSVPLHFDANRVVESSDAMRLLIWEDLVPDAYGGHMPADPNLKAIDYFRMALIQLPTGQVLAEKKSPDPLYNVVKCGEFFIHYKPSGSSSRFEALRAQDLETVKSIVAKSNINFLGQVGKALVVQTSAGLEIYDLHTWERIHELSDTKLAWGPGVIKPPMFDEKPTGIYQDSLYLKGVLVDEQLKPKLILSPVGLPQVSGAKLDWYLPGTGVTVATREIRKNFGSFGYEKDIVASVNIPNANAVVSLELSSPDKSVPGAMHTQRAEIELNLLVKRSQSPPATPQTTLLQTTLFKEERPSSTQLRNQSRMPQLSVTGGHAYAIFERKLYRQQLPQLPAPAKLSIVPVQSTFTFSNGEKTKLTHTAVGGKAPYRFKLYMPLESASIDEKTGTVTFLNEAIMAEAVKVAEKALLRGIVQAVPASPAEYAQKSQKVIDHGTEILGRKPNGIPVAIPLRVEVRDADDALTDLQYYILAEVPSGPLNDKAKQQHEEWQARIDANKPKPKPVPGAPGEPTNPSRNDELRRRVDAIEERLDNMTRQLNQILKKLDEK